MLMGYMCVLQGALVILYAYTRSILSAYVYIVYTYSYIINQYRGECQLRLYSCDNPLVNYHYE